MNDLYIDFLAEELLKEKLVIFVGAGASIDSNLPSWNTLIQAFAKELKLKEGKLSDDEILDIPEEYYKIFGKVPFYDILDKIFNKEFSPNSIHEILEKLEINYIITTNFDTLIEKKLNKSYEYDVIKKDEDLAHSSRNKMIIKMHGDLKNKNIILKRSDFKEYTKKFPLISTFIKGLFTTNTILFIGYSLNDPNVKNMLSWIRKILKEDFRKVYLVDFKSNDKVSSLKDEKIINKIILPNLEKKEYLGISEEKLLENKGKLLTDFLEDLYKKREEKLEEENSLIYSNLDYLTEANLKALIKNLNIVEFNTDKILSNKKIASFDKENCLDIMELNKYIEILIKSNIIQFNEDSSINTLKDFNKMENLNKKQEKLEFLLDCILTFDRKRFIKFIEENNDIAKENLIVSGYIFFEEYNLAGEVLRSKLKEYQKDNNKIKIVWTYFLLENLERIDPKFFFFEEVKKKINLEKMYDKYFKRKTNLYYEINNFKTLEKCRNEMYKTLENVKNSKNSSFFGNSPLVKASFIVRDFYKFILYNGIPNNFLETHNILKNYIEILFILYKNNKDKRNFSIGEILTYEKFEYFDYFLMLKISTKDLRNLIMEYNINELETNIEDFNKLLITLKNLLSLFKPEQIHFNKFRMVLENVFLLIHRHKLTQKQFDNFFNIVFQSEKFDVFYNDNIYKELQNYFIAILDKNIEFVTDNMLKKIFSIIIKNRKKSSNYVMGMLTYYYSIKVSSKIRLTKALKTYFSKNDIFLKIYFLRLFNEEIKQKEINLLLKELNQNFNLKIYFELLRFNYIEFNVKLEENIIPALENTREINENFIYLLCSLIEGNKFSSEIKDKLKNYSNGNFKKYLKKYELETEWNYYIDRENFDYSNFSIKDLNNFTEYGVQQIIANGKNNKSFMNMLYKYLYSSTNNTILKGYLKTMFDTEVEK